MMVTAHPDDEDGGMLAYETRGQGARGILLTLNRGEGGQNAMSSDMYDALGLVRTQELLAADRYYGVDQYWTRAIDYGFSKTREEALEKWDHDRVLADVVRVIRMTRPLVHHLGIRGRRHRWPRQSPGGRPDGAGGLPRGRRSESLPGTDSREGLRPWTPLKVYARVPVLRRHPQGMYDYAIDKYVPVRFFDYVNQNWSDEQALHHARNSGGRLRAGRGPDLSCRSAATAWASRRARTTASPFRRPRRSPAPIIATGRASPPPIRRRPSSTAWMFRSPASARWLPAEPDFLKSGLAEIAAIRRPGQRQYRPDRPQAIAPAAGRRAARHPIAAARKCAPAACPNPASPT